MIATLVAIAAAYLLGSVPFALLLARRRGAGDLGRRGSGNLGAANVLRTSGVAAAFAVAALDIAKGAASVLIARQWSSGPVTPAAAGVAAIVGHVYPVWLKFRGGKGVATACGVFAVLTPAALPPALAVFLMTVVLTKYVSLGSMLASITVAFLAYRSGDPRPSAVAALAAAALILARHRSNFARLRAGTERRLGARA